MRTLTNRPKQSVSHFFSRKMLVRDACMYQTIASSSFVCRRGVSRRPNKGKEKKKASSSERGGPLNLRQVHVRGCNPLVSAGVVSIVRSLAVGCFREGEVPDRKNKSCCQTHFSCTHSSLFCRESTIMRVLFLFLKRTREKCKKGWWRIDFWVLVIQGFGRDQKVKFLRIKASC